MMHFRFFIAAAAALAALGSGPARANLLNNGDFSDGTLLSDTIPGWTVSNAQQGANAPYAQNVTLQLNSYLDPDNTGLSAWFNTGDSPTGGTLLQSFGTVVGQSYALGFQYGLYGNGANPQGVQVVVSDGATTDLSQSLTTSTFGVSPYEYTFTATGTTTTLSFTDTTASTIGSDGVLENVSVTTNGPVINPASVPEPASAALLLTGSLVLLRRRRAA